MISCLSFFLVPSRSSNTPFYPQSAASQKTCPNFLFFHYFHFRLTFESIKVLGGMSQQIPPSIRNLNIQNTLNIHHIHLLPILLIHNHISKWKNFHGIVILSKHPNNQIKGIGQSIFELKFCKKTRLRSNICLPCYLVP